MSSAAYSTIKLFSGKCTSKSTFLNALGTLAHGCFHPSDIQYIYSSYASTDAVLLVTRLSKTSFGLAFDPKLDPDTRFRPLSGPTLNAT